MSPDELNDLGQRAIACKRWRWVAGMLCRGERLRVTRDDPNPMVTDGSVPDLADAATLGCLMALVEEAYDFPVCAYNPRINRSGWLVESAHDSGQSLATSDIKSTRAAALVAALKDAP